LVAGCRWLLGSVLMVLAECFVARRSSSGHQVSEEARLASSDIFWLTSGIIDDAMALEDKEKIRVMPGATLGWTGEMVLLEQHPAMCSLKLVHGLGAFERHLILHPHHPPPSPGSVAVAVVARLCLCAHAHATRAAP
jgi:hypothetical protein